MAFHPIGETRVTLNEVNLRNDPILAQIAKSYNRTAAQILIRFSIQRNILPIPKTSKLERLKENISVFDFELDSSTMDQLYAMNVPKRFYNHAWIKKLSKYYPFSEEF